MAMKKLLIAAAVTAISSGLASAQDLAAGANSFRKCLACHEIGETAKNKVGPQLNGLDGRASGSASGYNYSDANIKNETEAKDLWAHLKQFGADGKKK